MRKSISILGDVAGWYGTAVILLAYALVSFSVVSPDGHLYQFLNLTGAAGIVILGLVKKVYQPVVLNSIWGLIALIAIIKLLL